MPWMVGLLENAEVVVCGLEVDSGWNGGPGWRVDGTGWKWMEDWMEMVEGEVVEEWKARGGGFIVCLRLRTPEKTCLLVQQWARPVFFIGILHFAVQYSM